MTPVLPDGILRMRHPHRRGIAFVAAPQRQCKAAVRATLPAIGGEDDAATVAANAQPGTSGIVDQPCILAARRAAGSRRARGKTAAKSHVRAASEVMGVLRLPRHRIETTTQRQQRVVIALDPVLQRARRVRMAGTMHGADDPSDDDGRQAERPPPSCTPSPSPADCPHRSSATGHRQRRSHSVQFHRHTSRTSALDMAVAPCRSSPCDGNWSHMPRPARRCRRCIRQAAGRHG